MRILVVVAVLCGGSSLAQCVTDSDCPAGGTCGNNGTCVTPGTPPPPPAPVRRLEPSVGDQTPKSSGWAGGAASIGFSATGLNVASGIIAMFFIVYGPYNSSTVISAVLFMAIEAAVVAGLGPLVHFGAQSARTDPANEGSIGMSVAGWTTYALSLGLSVASFPLYFAASGIAFFTQLGALIVGALSLMFFAIEAVECGTEAIRIRKRKAEKRVEGTLRVMPTFSFVPRTDGRTLDPIVGLAGLF